MKILITGGLGFMGSHMVRYLLNKYPDYQVVNVDAMTYAGNPANVADVAENPRYKFYRADIADKQAIFDIIASERPDGILNYAAETHVDRSILDPDAFLQTDILGTHHLLKAVREFEIPRMVQISTDEVYGSIEVGEFFESSPFMPNSPYSASKAGADHLCRAYAKSYHVPVITTHSCNFYGSHQHPEKVIPLFITSIMDGEPITVHGSGHQVREWIHTRDHCRAIDTIFHHGIPGDSYNIGSGKRRSVIQLAQKVVELMGADPSLIVFTKDRPGQDHRYAINCGKLRMELEWQPEMDFDAGLKETLEWYKANEGWWRALKEGEYKDYRKSLEKLYTVEHRSGVKAVELKKAAPANIVATAKFKSRT